MKGMRAKKLVLVVSTAAIVMGSAFLAYRLQVSEAVPAKSARVAGITNPQKSTAGMKAEPEPQLSTQRFEPPRPISTGTYTDPNYRKDSTQQDASKKNDTAR